MIRSDNLKSWVLVIYNNSISLQNIAPGFNPTPADYSPATVVAANKFKRFLGKHLKSHHGPGAHNNNKYGSITAPCSPVRTRELGGGESSDQSVDSEAGEATQSDSRHQAASLSCSKLTKINKYSVDKKSGNITGGWI